MPRNLPEPTPLQTREATIRVALALAAAAIAVFFLLPTDFDGAHRRRELQRAREDLLALSRTIDAYLIDQKTFPNNTPNADVPANFARFQAHVNGNLPTFTAEAEHALLDFYSGSSSERHYEEPLRFVHRGRLYLLASRGPDRQWNIDPTSNWGDGITANIPPALINSSYDPTNGAVSDGDIWLTGPR